MDGIAQQKLPKRNKKVHNCTAAHPCTHAGLVPTYLVGGRANAHRVQLRVLQHLVVISVRLAAMIQRAPFSQLAAARRDAYQVRLLQPKCNVRGMHLSNTTGADNADAEGLFGGIRLDEYQVVLEGQLGFLHPQGRAAGASHRRRGPGHHGGAMEGTDRQGCADGLRTRRKKKKYREQNISSQTEARSSSMTEQEPKVSSQC